jgi:peptide/nickel transport system permease protein
MLSYLFRRLAYMVPTLFLISIVSFAIIQLPPGDFLSTMVARLSAQGETVDQTQLADLRERYGLGEPIIVQYGKWMLSILTQWDFGQSFEWREPVAELLSTRLPLTIALSVVTLMVTWIIAFPIGVYSAVKQYSIGDYLATSLAFLGLATPNFLIALVLMYVAYEVFDTSVGGLFSPEFVESGWNLGKLIDLFGHMWIPVIVLGTAGTAGLIRILRANLLDELRKPYVVAARGRGVPERKLLLKYPLRVALNPFISTIGWVLPGLVSGEVIVAQVLSLPTTGPMLLGALRSQDMYLAGAIVLMISVLTVIGTLVSDLALAWLDPRVRMGRR